MITLVDVQCENNMIIVDYRNEKSQRCSGICKLDRNYEHTYNAIKYRYHLHTFKNKIQDYTVCNTFLWVQDAPSNLKATHTERSARYGTLTGEVFSSLNTYKYSRKHLKSMYFPHCLLLGKKCCGSVSESGFAGINCFCASRIRIHLSEIRIRLRIWIWIRILLSSSKNSKKNIDSYCFVTFL
jgi:hypothetical protein